DVNQAIAFEKQVKGWSRRKKAAIINNEWEKLPELSKNRQTLRQAQGDMVEVPQVTRPTHRDKDSDGVYRDPSTGGACEGGGILLWRYRCRPSEEAIKRKQTFC